MRRPPRAIALTAAARKRLGLPETVEVPLLDLPWRDERRDRRDDQEHRP